MTDGEAMKKLVNEAVAPLLVKISGLEKKISGL
jgi:hypothetical protein